MSQLVSKCSSMVFRGECCGCLPCTNKSFTAESGRQLFREARGNLGEVCKKFLGDPIVDGRTGLRCNRHSYAITEASGICSCLSLRKQFRDQRCMLQCCQPHLSTHARTGTVDLPTCETAMPALCVFVADAYFVRFGFIGMSCATFWCLAFYAACPGCKGQTLFLSRGRPCYTAHHERHDVQTAKFRCLRGRGPREAANTRLPKHVRRVSK
jgi:hypothetical protein